MHFSRPVVEPGSAEAAQAAINQAGAITGDVSVILFNLFVLWFLNRASIKALFQPSLPSQSTT
jgi:hypothetical protein